MAFMDNLSPFCCQNPDCPDYGLRGRDNLRVGFRYGSHKHRRMLVCRTCPRRFSERKGTALFATRLPRDQAVAVVRHLQDGCGVRQTGRLVGVDKDTVGRYARAAGRHAQDTHDEVVASSPSDPGGPVR
jgi:transposase-like protein